MAFNQTETNQPIKGTVLQSKILCGLFAIKKLWENIHCISLLLWLNFYWLFDNFLNSGHVGFGELEDCKFNPVGGLEPTVHNPTNIITADTMLFTKLFVIHVTGHQGKPELFSVCGYWHLNFLTFITW